MTCSNCGSVTTGAFCTNCGAAQVTAQQRQVYEKNSTKSGKNRLGLGMSGAFAALTIVGSATIYGILSGELEKSLSAENSLQAEISNQQKKITAAEEAYSDAQSDYLARLICDINYYWWTCDALYGTESNLLNASTSAKSAVDSGKAALEALRSDVVRENSHQKTLSENLSVTLYVGGGFSSVAILTTLFMFFRYNKSQNSSVPKVPSDEMPPL